MGVHERMHAHWLPFVCLAFLSPANAAEMVTDIPTQDIIAPVDNPVPQTPCATAVMERALNAASAQISETAAQTAVRDWIYNTLRTPDVARQILECPEIASLDRDATIAFDPVTYTFPSGRQITIRRTGQPHVLERQMTLGQKRDIPNAPRIGTDGAIWTNTDPAWYGILVVQAGALNDFVGPDRPNTISLQYINDNIDTLYPQGDQCTSRSALANNNDIINLAAKETVSMEDDSNDYYVAGDVNLQWITWGEVALDVAITVFTAGGGAAVLGLTKGARATRAAKNLVGVIKNLERVDAVQDYIRMSQRYARAAAEIKKLDRVADAAKYADRARDMETAAKRLRELEKMDDVRDYRRATDAFSDVMKYRTGLRSLRAAQRGNVIARAWRAARAANTGGKTIKRAARVGRASMQSGRVRDWLFQSTLKNAGKLAKVVEASGLLYGTIHFFGDMYDMTETSTGDFTNGIDFKPLGLLSADDIQGQENVVNHGMWLMWAGDSTSMADDDAAFLQAMDFAEKFYTDTMDTMDAHDNHACDIDIYVVRPVIRDPGTDRAALYYLIMNDKPWSTVE